jgi:hypothetical protein
MRSEFLSATQNEVIIVLSVAPVICLNSWSITLMSNHAADVQLFEPNLPLISQEDIEYHIKISHL